MKSGRIKWKRTVLFSSFSQAFSFLVCLCSSSLLAPNHFHCRRFLYWQSVLMKCHLRQLADRIDVPELFSVYLNFPSLHFSSHFLPWFFSPIYFTTLEITFLSLLICNPEWLWKFRNMSCRQVTAVMPHLESFQCLNNTKCSTCGKIHFNIYKWCKFLLKAILVVKYYFKNNTLF